MGRDHVIDHWDHHVHHVNHQPNVHDQCSLVDKFGWLLQGFVLVMAIATLALKRHLERPQRPYEGGTVLLLFPSPPTSHCLVPFDGLPLTPRRALSCFSQTLRPLTRSLTPSSFRSHRTPRSPLSSGCAPVQLAPTS